MRETRSGMVHIMAGCFICDPDGKGRWFAKNALGVAARHHDSTGHPTWCEYGVVVNYGNPPDRQAEADDE